MQRNILEQLKHWIELAEKDGERGDEDALSAKLLLLRAEVENALGISRRPVFERVKAEITGARLVYKYAFASALFIFAIGLALRSEFGGRFGDFSRAGLTSSDSHGAVIPIATSQEGSGHPGSELPGSIIAGGAGPLSVESVSSGAEVADAVSPGPPVGKGIVGKGKVRNARRLTGGNGNASAAAPVAAGSKPRKCARFKSTRASSIRNRPPARVNRTIGNYSR